LHATLASQWPAPWAKAARLRAEGAKVARKSCLKQGVAQSKELPKATLASARLPLAFLIFILYLKIRIKTARLPLASSRLRAEGAEGAEGSTGKK
jgi:hypothetical protein